MPKKTIGSKEILTKYQIIRRSISEARDVFESRCNKQLQALDKLREHPMNDSDEARLSRAMARVVAFKEGILFSWNETLKDDLLENH